MCLARLADRWARRRGGQVTALTVDHGLRPDSAAEAAQVARWMRSSGIVHHILTWSGTKPSAAIQSTARDARYRLLEGWCRNAGRWHLLVGHHQGDQAETVMLRMERGSGRDGLAAMPVLAERSAVRVLRPLIGFSSRRLRQTLIEAGQDWIEDPSNRDRNFARARVRDTLAADSRSFAMRDRLAGLSAQAAGLRARDERTIAALLARVCTLHPAGFVSIDRDELASAQLSAQRRALARIVLCVSGRPYAPSRAAMARLSAAILMPGFTGRTLGGCHFAPIAGAILVCREARNLQPPIALGSNFEGTWDGRIKVEAVGPCDRDVVTLGALGREGWREIVAARPELRGCGIPAPARWSLPALRDAIGIFAVPHLGYNRTGTNSWDFGIRRLTWEPKNALSQRLLWLAPREIRPI